jgi:hypothetical protein
VAAFTQPAPTVGNTTTSTWTTIGDVNATEESSAGFQINFRNKAQQLAQLI